MRGEAYSERAERGEPEQTLQNVLFKGRDYCRLVVSSHFALIDRKFQEGIRFFSSTFPHY